MFKDFQKRIENKFSRMSESNLFRVYISGDILWGLYIKSFKKEDDPVFRDPESSTHTCNNDKHFIRRYGNVVSIINNEIVTMWDLDLEESSPYYLSCKAMSEAIKSCNIVSVFMEEFSYLNFSNYEKTSKKADVFRLGHEKSLKKYSQEEVDKFGVVNTSKVYEFDHFHVYLPKNYVHFQSTSLQSVLGELNTSRQLFAKGLQIPIESIELVRDLIQQGSLLKGDIYLPKVLEFIKLKKKFDKVSSNHKEFWIWLNFQNPFARFANELIGTTCIELAEGKDINKVCKDFNYRIDPSNYMKAKAPVTKAMIDIAEKQIAELGYSESFERRFATIDDIDVSEIKHSNIDNTVEKPVGLFGKAGVPSTQFSRHKRAEFDKVETVDIDKFMFSILPNVSSIEVFLENRMEDNLVSLFTEKKPVKNLFKWNNSFSWTYNGNLSGKSMIKENVKAAGGKVDGILRFSIQWNDKDTPGNLDWDAHCITPENHIYYSNKKCMITNGWLDVDMIRPSKVGVENITWQNKSKMVNGTYEFFNRNFDNGNNTGFKAEIEIEGEVYSYHVTGNLKGDIKVATVTLKNGVFSIQHHLPETNSSKKLWGLDSNQFHKVNLVCTSPNYWGDNNIGTKEYFFMLQDCKTPDTMRAFHVDQLNSELMEIRKAIDLLGNYKMVEPSSKQLSGIGFNGTVKDELIVKVKGSHQRVLKIQF